METRLSKRASYRDFDTMIEVRLEGWTAYRPYSGLHRAADAAELVARPGFETEVRDFYGRNPEYAPTAGERVTEGDRVQAYWGGTIGGTRRTVTGRVVIATAKRVTIAAESGGRLRHVPREQIIRILGDADPC